MPISPESTTGLSTKQAKLLNIFRRIAPVVPGFFALLLAACASYGVVDNQPFQGDMRDQRYSVASWDHSSRTDKLTFLLTFSGGGTRAAAMAYGVLAELRATEVVINGQSRRLIDEIDFISSVSGGSFTAAFYGLYGDRLFESFEQDFLRYDIEKHLVRGLFNPIHWFESKGRTDRAIEYYQKTLFHGSTFADMMKPGRPMIIINASDLAYGIRFSFIQEYFDFLCSDLASFPVANAVTASSAVPVLFNPVVIENYNSCGDSMSFWPADAEERARENFEFATLYEELNTYLDKDQRKYIHLVDGGITDNMGLRALPDVISISGGAAEFLAHVRKQPPEKILLISVNASTGPITDMDQSPEQPSTLAAMSAATNTEILRYDDATLDLIESRLNLWAKQFSTPETTITPYFLQVSFNQVQEPQLRRFLDAIPTSFDLSDEQVDRLITSGRMLLRENPRFKAFLSDLASQ